MHIKRWLPALALVAFSSFNFGSCGSSDSTTTTTSSSTKDVGAAASDLFGGLGSQSSQSPTLKEQTSNFTACNVVSQNMGPSGISFSTSGTAGTYGTSTNSKTVGASDFCAGGGTIAAWSIATAMSMTCTDSAGTKTTLSMTGSGIFQLDSSSNSTQIWGNFVVGSSTVGCYFTIAGKDGSPVGGCEDSSSKEAISLGSGITCDQS